MYVYVTCIALAYIIINYNKLYTLMLLVEKTRRLIVKVQSGVDVTLV